MATKEEVGSMSAEPKTIARPWMDKLKTSQNIPLLLLLLALVVALSSLSDVFLTPVNLFSVGRQVSINGLLALGMTFVIIGGGIDLSVGAVVALVSAEIALLAKAGTPTVVIILAALLAGAAIGAISGLLVSKARITPFIATLATMSVCRGAVLIISEGTPITFDYNPVLSFIGNGLLGPVPFPLIVLALVAIVCHIISKNTKFGLHVYALGSSEEAARLSGINTKLVQGLTYVLSGLLCAVAALILTARVNSAQPTAGELFELDAIAAAVIGGTSMTGGIGTISGTILGVLILGVIGNGLNLLNVSSYWQYVIRGVIIVIAVGIDILRSRRAGG